MSSKNTPLTDIGKFYKQIDDFKEKIILIMKQFNKEQEIIELNKYYDKLMLIKKVNVRKPIELLYTYGVSQYVEKILIRDEMFFLGEVSKIEIDDENIGQQDLFFISQIRQVWQNLHSNVRNNIWDYIQIICILSEKVVGGNILSMKREMLKNCGQLK